MSRKKNKKGLVVNGYSERWLRKGFPWVYRKEIQSGGGSAGTERPIWSTKGDLLGRGILDDGWIGARVYRHDGGPLDREWLFATLDRADRFEPSRISWTRLD